MKQTIKWFIASLMVMVCLQVTAQPEGKFYLYNTAYKVFLSRSATSANVDAFGIPVEIKKGSSGYSLMFLDNGRYVAQSGTSVKGDQSSAAYAIIEGVEGVYQIEFNGSLGVDNDLTLGIKAIPTDTSADPSLSSFGCLWELKTQAERDAIVAENELAQIEAVAKAAGIKLATDGDKMASFTEALAAYTREDATELVTNPTLATSQDGWTVNVLAGNQNISYKSQYPMTLYQNTAMEISQTIEVPNGVYKATIQNTYRSSKREHLTTLAENDGISICNAYFAANENQVQAVEWSKIRTSSTLPYSRGDFDNFTTNPKYTTTVWACVKDGKLTLKYAVPSINNSQGDYDLNWFTFANVTLTRYFKASEAAAEQFDLYNQYAEQSSDASSYYAVLNSFKEQLAAGSMSDDDVENAKATLRSELFKLMKTVPARSGQYDITGFLKNPDLTKISGWTTPSSYFALKSGLVECYNVKTAARMYQTIKDMPAGEYTVKVQGFYRNGEWKQALANYERGKDVVKASIYIDDFKENISPLKSIFDDGCYMLKGKHHKSADVYAIVSGRGYPHSHYIDENNRSNNIKTPDIAAQAIKHGHYWNEMTATHAEDGNLIIGITLASGAPAEDWIVVDNFRLYYGASGPVTITDNTSLPPAVKDDTYADVVVKKSFKAGELTPFAAPCDIPASKFKAVYAIGALDAETQKAVLVPVDHVSANVPCYVVTDKDVDEITAENTYITSALADQLPIMWDGGLIYRIDGTFDWKMLSYDEKEYDSSHFTQFEYVDAKHMAFAANIENYRARTYIENTSYPEPETPSVIGNYFLPAPPRLDIPHNIGVPVPAAKVKDAVVKFGLKSDFSDATTRMVLDGSDMAYMPNLVPCNTYYFKVEAGDEVLTQGTLWVDGPVRMIYAPSINNIRDIGGWTVQDGKQVRYGLIYRGGEANGLHPSVAEDRQTLIDLGVGAEIDLRKDNNYDSGNGQVGKCAFGFPKADYFFKEGGYDCKLEHLTNSASKARYKQWFPFILEHIREGKAVYYHCVWGADRTGLVSVLLEGLLGLTQEQMNKEYELTSLSFAGLRPKSGYADGDHQKLIEKIKTYEGETLRDKFDTYWTKEVGISQDLIDEFRSIMLVDAPAAAIKGICLTEKTVPSGIKAVYSVSGTKLPASVLNSKKGTYVVEYNNGTTQKVTVK
ncbi:MAG: tyrosine-protein phosphatase [Bacteroidaceae bacterium]|nr:tyrosine-protein phosphatase [Bacteroidaceae bacterium]